MEIPPVPHPWSLSAQRTARRATSFPYVPGLLSFREAPALVAALRTREGRRPVLVSVGHRVDLSGAVCCVLEANAGHRLPEPAYLADRLVRDARRTLQ
jgi:deoxyinosine 3'endonuclease (endonuclease V)